MKLIIRTGLITETGVGKDVAEHSNREGAYMLQVAAARLQELFRISTAYPPDGAKVNRRLILLVATVATMAAYFVPFLLFGNNSYITIHDNLHGTFVTNYLLVATDNLANDVRRSAYKDQFNVLELLPIEPNRLPIRLTEG